MLQFISKQQQKIEKTKIQLYKIKPIVILYVIK